MSETDDAYELVMPFKACKSQGGEYDDDSFVAGWRLAEINSSLEQNKFTTELIVSVRIPDLDQLDLIAMRHNFQCEPLNGGSGEEWIVVKLIVSKLEEPSNE